MLLDIEKRSITNALWKLQEADQREVLTLTQRFELPEILARALVNRGVNVESAGSFLYPLIRSLLPDPFHLLDMDKAVCRIIRAISNNENIAIFGDYDVDGATSSALINRYLRMIGVHSIIYIPDRVDEGYGLNVDALLQLKKKGIDLCISVDCGTLAYQPIEEAKGFGLDIIVIDHHLGTEKLPSAVAVVNPNRLDESSPYISLAAVGVSFLLVVALNKSLREQGFFTNRKEPDLFNLLDLVALGTVCDVMQITGLNRAFVSQGLKVMSARKNVGLRVLSDALGILEKPSVSRLGFNIGPCINSGGRIGEASLGARLLSTDNEEEAYSIALKLIDLNNARKMLENEAFLEAATQVKKSTQSGAKFIMVSGNWHQGIIGIIASRLKEQFHLPTIVISLSNGIGKASCRSIPGVDIGAAVLSAKLTNLITEGGGHSMAAGFSVEENKINHLYDFFTERFTNSTNDKALKADGMVTVKAINLSLWNQLQRLEPFGVGNPEPRFIIRGAKIRKPEIVGVDHIKCIIADNDAMVRAIAFRSANTHLGSAIMQGNIEAILGKISMNYWNGNEFVQFLIEDVLTID
ncbi:single-stranded-DNA-specific exonuclease RecJ [Wolbachia endosymbiont of Ctenocephalides felis wCfeJ]|uniref:single-stranded-DNA-specific exonuclease RecJ n=1 Tax=Wolbachia endosymbiont of Ctenocephalides felis wCfeJ TaxID=2732594 RepID=UPI0014455D66|nr:single-stranded-DNA-specific exonuclease RecJ [Wolbachia endosymbiont of Ctenocephalides felis wCfeJ]WCR58103.1 MAG: Single-stranded-DNA-specific exonuclease RecJ [Wolbachia endosymbiont of Ctenocephalides felis wCfeJ]